MNAPIIPFGWQLVPVEPDANMREAIAFAAGCAGGIAFDIWKAGVEAAPLMSDAEETAEFLNDAALANVEFFLHLPHDLGNFPSIEFTLPHHNGAPCVRAVCNAGHNFNTDNCDPPTPHVRDSVDLCGQQVRKLCCGTYGLRHLTSGAIVKIDCNFPASAEIWQ